MGHRIKKTQHRDQPIQQWSDAAKTKLDARSKHPPDLKIKPITMHAGAKIASALRNLTGAFKTVENPLRILRFGSVASAPFAIKSIGEASVEIYRGAPDKLDNTLLIASETGTLGSIVSTVAEGLQDVGAVSSVASWVFPLAAVSVGFTVAGIVRDAKGFYATHKFSKVFLKHSASDLPGYKDKVSLIKKGQKGNVKFVSKHFDTDAKTMIERLDRIGNYAKLKLASPLQDKITSGKRDTQETVKVLAKRLTFRKISRAFSALVATINLIGVSLLFSPAAPIGCLLIGIGAIMTVGQIALIKKVNRQFEKTILKTLGEDTVIVPK